VQGHQSSNAIQTACLIEEGHSKQWMLASSVGWEWGGAEQPQLATICTCPLCQGWTEHRGSVKKSTSSQTHHHHTTAIITQPHAEMPSWQQFLTSTLIRVLQLSLTNCHGRAAHQIDAAPWLQSPVLGKFNKLGHC